MNVSSELSATGERGQGTDGETLKEVRDCVVSWLQNDRQHVTVRTIQLEYNFVSRREASLVLQEASKEILSKQDEETTSNGLEISRVNMTTSSSNDNRTTSPTSVLSLFRTIVTSPQSIEFPTDFSEGSIYSVCPLAPLSAEDGDNKQKHGLYSVQNAHEADLLKVQDAYKSKSMPPINGSSGPTIRPSSPLLAELSSTKENSSPVKPTGGGLYCPTRSTATGRLKEKQQKNMVKALQPSQPLKQKAKTSAAPEALSSNTSAPPAKVSSSNAQKATTASKFFANNQKKKNQRKTEKKTIESESKEVCRKEKEVGNADDFVGDEESDDDEKDDGEVIDKTKITEEEMETDVVQMGGNRDEDAEEKKEKKGSKAKKRIAEDEKDNETPDEPVKGAMDAFASAIAKKHPSPSQQEQSSSGKRRRRVTKEETFMTDDGYIKTQTVSVWEDIPTDEEEEIEKKHKLASSSSSSTTLDKQPKSTSNANTAAKSKSSSTTSGGKKKQLGLNAFFSKKK